VSSHALPHPDSSPPTWGLLQPPRVFVEASHGGCGQVWAARRLGFTRWRPRKEESPYEAQPDPSALWFSRVGLTCGGPGLPEGGHPARHATGAHRGAERRGEHIAAGGIRVRGRAGPSTPIPCTNDRVCQKGLPPPPATATAGNNALPLVGLAPTAAGPIRLPWLEPNAACGSNRRRSVVCVAKPAKPAGWRGQPCSQNL
jgi:hypothetical protein